VTSARRGREALVAAAFLAPSFLVFGLFKYYPLLYNFYLSLTSWNFFTPAKKFIGLANYRSIFVSSQFWQVMGQTLFYTVWSTLLSLVIGFALAAALFRRRGPLGTALKTLFFIPNITTASAVALLWIWIFDPEGGLAGQLFSLFGGKSPTWLLTPKYAMWIVISLSVWRSLGYVMLIYHSGMSGISGEIYDAASIDGANSRQQLFRITLPLLRPTSFFLVLTSFISAMQVFDIVSVMTGGGPYGTTMVMNLYIYQMAFVRSKAGYASALSTILFLLVLVVTVLQRKASAGGEEHA
jgi:multiple sugar transport system permease protein/sn-glycerol 3-phosphate transport system permease protein